MAAIKIDGGLCARLGIVASLECLQYTNIPNLHLWITPKSVSYRVSNNARYGPIYSCCTARWNGWATANLLRSAVGTTRKFELAGSSPGFWIELTFVPL